MRCQVSDDKPERIVLTEEQKRKRRARSIAIALLLAVIVIVIFAYTLVVLGPDALGPPS